MSFRIRVKRLLEASKENEPLHPHAIDHTRHAREVTFHVRTCNDDYLETACENEQLKKKQGTTMERHMALLQERVAWLERQLALRDNLSGREVPHRETSLRCHALAPSRILQHNDCLAGHAPSTTRHPKETHEDRDETDSLRTVTQEQRNFEERSDGTPRPDSPTYVDEFFVLNNGSEQVACGIRPSMSAVSIRSLLLRPSIGRLKGGLL